jgi:hypothetical protein
MPSGLTRGIILKKKLDRDDDSKKSHPDLADNVGADPIVAAIRVLLAAKQERMPRSSALHDGWSGWQSSALMPYRLDQPDRLGAHLLGLIAQQPSQPHLRLSGLGATADIGWHQGWMARSRLTQLGVRPASGVAVAKPVPASIKTLI